MNSSCEEIENILIRLCSTDVSTLKALRLACRQFAYLSSLNEVLFYRLSLRAEPEAIRSTETADFKSLEPYVEKIVFTPTKYSWDMTETVFREITLSEPLLDYCDQYNAKVRRQPAGTWDGRDLINSNEIVSLGYEGFAQKHLNGKMLIVEEEVHGLFEKYIKSAEELRGMFETGRVQRAWAKALLQLPRVRSFTIEKCEFEHQYKHIQGSKGVATGRQLQAPVGEAVLNGVIASLIAAGSKPEKLSIKTVVEGKYTWADDNILDTLDLSTLRTLTFEPLGPLGREDYELSSARETELATRFDIAITSLLLRSGTTLQHLRLYKGWHMYDFSWPPRNIPPLSALSSFKTALPLRLTLFAAFLANSPVLSSLQLDGCHADYEDDSGDWRILWDAIRNHPSRMQLHFDQLPCHEATELSVEYHTGEESTAAWDDDPWMNIDYSMEHYLSGKRHWDRSLEEWFGDGEGTPGASEDEDEESDGDEDEDEEMSDQDEDEDEDENMDDGEDNNENDDGERDENRDEHMSDGDQDGKQDNDDREGHAKRRKIDGE